MAGRYSWPDTVLNYFIYSLGKAQKLKVLVLYKSFQWSNFKNVPVSSIFIIISSFYGLICSFPLVKL